MPTSFYKYWWAACLATALLPLLPFETVHLPAAEYATALWQQHTGKVLWALLLLPALHGGWYYRRQQPAAWPTWVLAGWLLLYSLHKGRYFLPGADGPAIALPAVGWYAALILALGWAWLGWQLRRQQAAA